MRWFGPEGHTPPRCKNVKIPTPIGEECAICENSFEAEDLGESYNDLNFHVSCLILLRERQRRAH